MGKMIVGMVAAVVGFMTVAGIGAATNKFDYKTATEERQQKYLDNIVSGFEAGFKLTAGRTAAIERAKANADWDTISIDIKFNTANVNNVSSGQIEAFRKEMYSKNCKWLAKNRVFEHGVAMKIRMKRPNGAALTSFTFDGENCAAWLA